MAEFPVVFDFNLNSGGLKREKYRARREESRSR
jgi:hypothetical protein